MSVAITETPEVDSAGMRDWIPFTESGIVRLEHDNGFDPSRLSSIRLAEKALYYSVQQLRRRTSRAIREQKLILSLHQLHGTRK